MNFFLDDAKLFKKVESNDDGRILQQDLDRLGKEEKWEMDSNIKKCNVMEFGKSKNRTMR